MSATPPAEVEVDDLLVRRLLRDQHPDLSALPIRLLDSGWDNYIFRLGDDFLVRLPRRQAAVQLLLNEQEWLPLFQDRLPIRIPAPYRKGKAALGYPWPWSVVPYLPGKDAGVEIPRSDQAVRFGSFLKALHADSSETAPENEHRGVPLRKRADTVEERMQRLALKTDLITKEIKHLWKTALQAPDSQQTKWLHGDLHARNVLVEQGVITGVIDWGDFTSGDVATDLASIWMLFEEAAARENTILAYGGIDLATRQRAMGWAIFFGVVLLDSGLVDDPRLAKIGKWTLERLKEDS